MNIFISHKDKDRDIALKINTLFRKSNIKTYLDLLDDNMEVDGKKLTNHLKKKLKSLHI